MNRCFGSFLRLTLALLFATGAFCAEVIPPKPQRYFNDYARVVSPAVAEQLNARLEQLEKTDSTQVVVAIFDHMESESSIDDYTLRVAQNWGVGQKGKSNGAILFVFIKDRKMFLQTGYGVEGAIPDSLAKDITENRIKPAFRNGNYSAGLTAGVDAIIQAVHGEYKGTGRTVAQGRQQKNNGAVVIGLIILFLIIMRIARRSGHVYGSGGRRGWSSGPIIWGGGNWGGGGGSWGGGGGGGSFSGGGGGFGGGGAGSNW